MPRFPERFSRNLNIVPIHSSKNFFNTQKTIPIDNELFLKQLRIIIPYFCRHPSRIIEEIEELREEGLDSIIRDLKKLTKGNANVWRGTLGEAIAAAYVIACTSYKIPVFKLRLSPNRKQAMHGDDTLGFQFKDDGTPKALMVLEAKNYKTPRTAVKDAIQGLLNTKDSSPTLFDFIINALREKGKFEDARLIKRFLNQYVYPYKTEYQAFIVADKGLWKDSYFDRVGEDFGSPLTVNSFLIDCWESTQQQLTVQSNQEPTKLKLPEIKVDELQEIRKLFGNSLFQNELNQLASEALAIDLNIERRAKYKYDQGRLEKAAHYLSLSGLDLLQEDPDEAEKLLKESAIIHERLAVLKLENEEFHKAYENIIESALIYSIAGYNANAKVLMDKVIHQIDAKDILSADSAKLFLAYLLTGKISNLQDSLAAFFLNFTNRTVSDSEFQALEDDDWIDLIAEKVSDIGDWLTARAFAVFTQYLRSGDEQYLEKICQLSQSAARQYATTSNYAAYVLLNSLSQYFCSLIHSSIHKLVRASLPEFDTQWQL